MPWNPGDADHELLDAELTVRRIRSLARPTHSRAVRAVIGSAPHGTALVYPGLEKVTQIFLSHASEHAALALAICDALEVEGFRCWIAPRDIVPGKQYAESIVEAVDGCDLLLLILSSFANDSGHVLREVERAASRGKGLLTVRIENVEPSKGISYFIQAHQWLEVAGMGSDQMVSQVVRAMQAREASSPDVEGSPVLATRELEPRRVPPGSASVPVDEHPAPESHEVDGRATVLRPVGRRTWGIAAVLAMFLIWAVSTLLPDAADRQKDAETSLVALTKRVAAYVTSIQEVLEKPRSDFLAGRDSEIDRLRGGLSELQEQLAISLSRWRSFAKELERAQVHEAADVEILEGRFAGLVSERIGERSLEEALTSSASARSTIERLARESEAREKERLKLQGALSERIAAFDKTLGALPRADALLSDWDESKRLEELTGRVQTALEKPRATNRRLSESAYPDAERLADLTRELGEFDLDSVAREVNDLAKVFSDYREWASRVARAREGDRRELLREGVSIGRRLVSVMKESQSGYEIAAGLPGEEEFVEKRDALRQLRDGLRAHAGTLRSQLANVGRAESPSATESDHRELLTATRAALEKIDQAVPTMSKEARDLAAAIERLAGTASEELNRQNELRRKADDEVQWALGVEGDDVVWINVSDRKGLVSKRHSDHSKAGMTQVAVTFESGGHTLVEVCAACAKFTERAVGVRMRMNGDRKVQTYTNLSNGSESLVEKRRAIQEALALDLSRRVAGLRLMPEEIEVSWPRSPGGDERKLELNKFIAEGFTFSIPQLIVPSRLSGKAPDGTRGDPAWASEIRSLEAFLESVGS